MRQKPATTITAMTDNNNDYHLVSTTAMTSATTSMTTLLWKDWELMSQ